MVLRSGARRLRARLFCCVRGAVTDNQTTAWTLTPHETKAMREFKARLLRGETMGTRKIVSMQGLEKVGLVKPVFGGGIIRDWQITPAGEVWNG